MNPSGKDTSAMDGTLHFPMLTPARIRCFSLNVNMKSKLECLKKFRKQHISPKEGRFQLRTLTNVASCGSRYHQVPKKKGRAKLLGRWLQASRDDTVQPYIILYIYIYVYVYDWVNNPPSHTGSHLEMESSSSR